jgi:hypothetical protein
MRHITLFEDFECIKEDTSATGGLASNGMGAVVSANPSSLAGSTIGTNWGSNGGTIGSGDISVPYNPGGSDRMIQKIPVMGYNHGARTGKKSREKKVDMKALRLALAGKKKGDDTDSIKLPKSKKVMSFDDFAKSDINKIKK